MLRKTIFQEVDEAFFGRGCTIVAFPLAEMSEPVSERSSGSVIPAARIAVTIDPDKLAENACGILHSSIRCPLVPLFCAQTSGCGNISRPSVHAHINFSQLAIKSKQKRNSPKAHQNHLSKCPSAHAATAQTSNSPLHPRNPASQASRKSLAPATPTPSSLTQIPQIPTLRLPLHKPSPECSLGLRPRAPPSPPRPRKIRLGSLPRPAIRRLASSDSSHG